MKRRLAVIMMADMVDYTRLMESDQAATVGLIRELRERWFEPKVAAHEGEVLKRLGDGWIAAFPSITAAIEAAQQVQGDLGGHPRIKLRVALHLGEYADDGTDLYGTAINIAARLQTEAPPGGVMISEDLHRQLDEREAESFSDAGTFELKNVALPVTGYQWRPAAGGSARADDVPVIAVEPIAVAPASDELSDAAADFRDQLLTRLSRRTGITVHSADSDDDKAANYLLRGRLRASSAKVKIALSLVLRDSATVVWSGEREGAPDNLYDMIDEMADQSDAALRVEINAFDGRRIENLPDDALNASELRTRAAQNFYKTTIESYQTAQALLEKSLALAPGNGMSLAMWAHARSRLIGASFEEPDADMVEEIVSRTNQAVEAAPDSDFVGTVRAEVYASLLGDIAGAKQSLRRVAQMNPGYALLHYSSAVTDLAAGDYQAAMETMADVVVRSERDPFLPIWLYIKAVAEIMGGAPDKAIATISEAIELRPSCRAYLLVLAEAHARAGDGAAAAAAEARAQAMPAGPNMGAPRLVLPEADSALMARLKASATGGE